MCLASKFSAMKKYFNLFYIAGFLFLMLTAVFASASTMSARINNPAKQESITTAQLLGQLYLYSNQAMLSAKLAADKSSDALLKKQSAELVDRHIQFNEAIRLLAKDKKVDLPMSLPDGGQRPDGRVDSAPENLRDTTRTQKATSEAEGDKKLGRMNGVNEASVTEEVNRLKALSAADFNKAYLASAVSVQQKLSALLSKGASSSDKMIKSFSKKQLSAINAQLRKMEKL